MRQYTDIWRRWVGNSVKTGLCWLSGYSVVVSSLTHSYTPYLCGMLSAEEEKFLEYWSVNGEKQRTSARPFFVGLSGGFTIGIAVMILLSSGWYERANMEANSRLSGIVFLLAILVISFFLAFFYRKFRWEMQEQRYRELLARKKRNQKENQGT